MIITDFIKGVLKEAEFKEENIEKILEIIKSDPSYEKTVEFEKEIIPPVKLTPLNFENLPLDGLCVACNKGLGECKCVKSWLNEIPTDQKFPEVSGQTVFVNDPPGKEFNIPDNSQWKIPVDQPERERWNIHQLDAKIISGENPGKEWEIPKDAGDDFFENMINAQDIILQNTKYPFFLANKEHPEDLSKEKQMEQFLERMLGFCGCAMPNEAVKFLYRVLELIDSRYQGDVKNENFEESFKKQTEIFFNCGGLETMFFYWLNMCGVCEHGGSCTSSWLTPEGKDILEGLRNVDLEKMYE